MEAKRNFGIGASPAKAHKPGHTKEIKGTSIFGKSPKDFVVDAAKNIILAKDWKARGLRKPDEGFAWYKDTETGKISQMSK